MTMSRTRPSADHNGQPIAAILYLRLSDGRNENGSMTEREAKLREKAKHLGWTVVRVVIENDAMPGGTKSASAFKRRRITLPDGRVKLRVFRPGFRSILDDLAAGRAKALLAEDLDRAMRDPRDLEDLIDMVRANKCWADSLSGSLRFTEGGTDSEIAMARVMVTMANKSSADTARRVSGGRERKAAKGEFGGGRRPYGFGAPKVDEVTKEPITDEDGNPVIDYSRVVKHEAELIADWADAVLTNAPLRGLARYVREHEIPTVDGTHRWQSTTLRDILLRPRNAGHAVHQGKIVGRLPWNASWLAKEYPILPDDVWRAVVAKLTDPARATAKPGPSHRWQGSGIYLCHCGAPLAIQCGTKAAPAYRCDVQGKGEGEGHVRRHAAKVDYLVDKFVVARLSGPKALALLDAPPTGGAVDLGALRAEVARLRDKKRALIAMHQDGDLTDDDLAYGLRRNNAMLDRIQVELAAHTDRSPLAGLPVGADIETVAEAWNAYPIDSKRAVIKELVTVTILRSGQRGSIFDPSTVIVRPRQPHSEE